MFKNIFKFWDYPLVIKIAVLVSVIAVAGFLVMHLFLLFKRVWGYFLNQKRKRLSGQFEDLSITSLVLNPDLGRMALQDIPLPLSEYERLGIYKNRDTRLFFIDYLRQLSENFSGNVHLLIQKLYQDLRLSHYALKRLRSHKRNIILALHELTFFNVLVDEERILQLINHRDKLIRQEATCYALKLFKEPFKVFGLIREPFSWWAQVEYFEIIKNRNTIEVPDFGAWIGPESNKSVVHLCLDLVVYFQQTTAASAIIDLLDTPDLFLRKRLINTLGKLFDPSSSAILEAVYDQEQDTGVKMEILKALGRMSNEDSTSFLRQKFKEENEVVLKKHAAYSLYNMHVSRTALIPLYKTASNEEKIVLSYIQNPLIKYI